jgi:glycogen debranching enzyme
MKAGLVRILDGNTFVLSDSSGDIEAAAAVPAGYFSFDTRFLSLWRLTLNGERLQALAIDDIQYFEVRFFLVPGAQDQYLDAKASVIRERSVVGVFEERLTVINHRAEPTDFTVRLDADSDFAPLLETQRQPIGRLYRCVEDRWLRLGYQREAFQRETHIRTSEPAEVDERGLTYRFTLGSHEQWSTTLRVDNLVLRPDREDVRDHLRLRRQRTRTQAGHDLHEWLDRAPKLQCDWEPLTMTYQRSLVDLAALRYSPLTLPDEAMPAGGAPWTATMMGRDSIFTSLQALPFAPDLAAATLRILVLTQGTVLDDFRDEEPGKVMREIRYGEAVAFEERPPSPYYGNADTTPLFVILLDEYERWTGDAEMVRHFEDEARAALRWIDEYGDIIGNGYIWYQRRNEHTGLENQCWKDSWDSISYHNGQLPDLPRATCELQGYAYDAKIRAARLAREFWNDPDYANQLQHQAATLKQRFNNDFWIEDRHHYALALDPDGHHVDALASNIGHLLWSGIVDDTKAAHIAEHLLGPQLFSGWGVRTLANTEERYNPLGYHTGTIWPFDNSIIAWGLRRYGFTHHAAHIAETIIDAAQYFDGRLPEAFGGYDRELTENPVPYPTANSPHAMSTGAPLLLLRVLLGLAPYGDDLVVAPELPAAFGRIELFDIPGRWGQMDAIGNPSTEPAGQPPSPAPR